ncbi:lithostathine-1-like [Ruditapes philippinarum]|uniref:lithostathine-1-like n=1 Tax=Ruditapes philippinarum TaxID=129788 RepID=UPI00295B58E7|nr:lithostathine-1-like [Ruditapes philippinarum]
MCHAYGSKLVNIEDADKLSKVAAFLSGIGVTDTANVFIGLTNMLNDPKVWVWYGGNKTEYTNWASGQPAIANRDNCVLMTAGNPDNKWKASSCLSGAFAVCEREAEIADLPA